LRKTRSSPGGRTQSTALRLVLLVVASGSCSVILDYGAAQCESQVDCDALAIDDARFVGTVCSADQVCAPPGNNTVGCVSSEQCTVEANGQPAICPTPGAACVPLLSQDCIQVVGDYQDPNAIIVGLMDLIVGSQLFESLRRFDECMLNLSLDQFGNSVGGLPNPDGNGVRPIAVVMCNEANSERASKHLIEDIGVKLILGPAFGTAVQDVVTKVSADANVLVIAPYTTSVSLIDLMDQGLAWMLTLNDATLVKIIEPVIGDIETKIRTANPMLTNLRLALVVGDDSGDLATGDYVVDGEDMLYNGGKTPLENLNMDCDGAPCFQRFDFDSSNEDWGTLANNILTYDPHMVYVVDGVGNFALSAMPLVEGATSHPEWVFQFVLPGVPRYIKGELGFTPPADLQTRVRGFKRVPSAESQQLYDTMKLNTIAQCPDIEMPFGFPPFVEFLYDGVFLTQYAYIAAGNCNLPTSQLTGQLLAKGLGSLAPEGQSDPENAILKEFKPSDIQSTVAALCSGGEVDVRGTSGDLDFDITVGTPQGSVEVSCIVPGTDFPNTAAWGRAQVWDSTTGTFDVPFECPAR
jgi:hypothetical protein